MTPYPFSITLPAIARERWVLPSPVLPLKIKLGEAGGEDPYVALVKRLAVNEKLDFDTAKILINAYKKQKKESEK